MVHDPGDPDSLRHPASSPVAFKELHHGKLDRMECNAKGHAYQGQQYKVADVLEGMATSRPVKLATPAPGPAFNEQERKAGQQQ
jgi:hypothetical protein